MAANDTQTYHVCESCNAKFFAQKTTVACPRCGEQSSSSDERDMPWQKLVTASEMEARYREQQRRLSCPGCGEAPFLG